MSIKIVVFLKIYEKGFIDINYCTTEFKTSVMKINASCILQIQKTKNAA
jgi:hypothetical protein